MLIPFDQTDPFPLLAPPGHPTLADEQEHSRLVDSWLQIDTARVEALLSARKRAEGEARDRQLWIDLPISAMLTPYTELRSLLAALAPAEGSTIVDLGAGYGRMGFVLGRHHAGVRFIGYELVPERVDEGARALSRWHYPGATLQVADLASPEFTPAAAEYYFLYDFGSRQAIAKALEDLKVIASARPIVVIGRGRASRDAIERGHPWLSQIVEPSHGPRYSIFRSRS